MEGAEEAAAGFAQEADRLRRTGVLGESGRLLDLFDFLAGRGDDAESASQAEIAEAVFGSVANDGDDPTVRVYIHRLRKRLEEHYAGAAAAGAGGRLVLPAGTYALRFRVRDPAGAVVPGGKAFARRAWLAGLVVALLAAFMLGWLLRAGGAGSQARANEIWQPFLDSERPITLVLGDYYIFGELDSFRPENSRLIRDFSINSPTDLARAQESDPARYERSEDVGLNYLPFSSAYALRALMPVLARDDRPVRVIAASDIDSNTLRESNVIYLGLVSGMGMLEETVFDGSGFSVGETYDELVDRASGRRYASEEALRLASTAYYRDYGYLASFRTPGGGLVGVVAAERETGLRALSPIAAAPELAAGLADVAGEEEFEALYEITGQQGADLTEKLVLARARPGRP